MDLPHVPADVVACVSTSDTLKQAHKTVSVRNILGRTIPITQPVVIDELLTQVESRRHRVRFSRTPSPHNLFPFLGGLGDLGLLLC